MKMKPRVGALFLILLLGLSHAQQATIDAIDDYSKIKIDPFLKTLPKTTNLELLEARFELIAKHNPNITIKDFIFPVVATTVLISVNELIFAEKFKKLYSASDYRNIETLRTKITEYLKPIETQYEVMKKNSINKVSEQSIAALDGIKKTSSIMITSDNALVIRLGQSLEQIDDAVISQSPPRSSHMIPGDQLSITSDLEKLMDQRTSKLKSVLVELDEAIAQTQGKIAQYNKLRWYGRFGSLVAGGVIAAFVIGIEYLNVDTEHGGMSFLNTAIGAASIDMKRDFLCMLTDKKNGFGLSFEEAGDYLTLIGRQ